MSQPIKSDVGTVLYTMRNNYERAKSELSEAQVEKQRLLDQILSASAGVIDDEVKNTIQSLVQAVKTSKE